MRSSTTGRSSHWALGAFVITVAAVLIASLFPAARLWGVNWYGYFGWPVRVVAAVIALAIGWFLWRRLNAPGANRDLGPSSYLRWSLPSGLCLTLAFFFLRARTHFLGDGYQLIAKLQEGEHTIKPLDIGSFTVQSWIYNALGQGKEAAFQTFEIISIACGFIVVALALLSAMWLFEHFRERLLWAVGVASGGYMLLFFGYAENYPLFVMTVLIFAILGLLAAKGRISRRWIVPGFLLTLVFHIFGVILLIPTIYLLLHDTGLSRRLARSPLRWRLSLGVVLLLAGAVWYIWLYKSSYLFRFNVLPVTADRFTLEGYTLFAGEHLLDYANMLLQLLPGTLVALVATMTVRSERSSDAASRFLAVMAIASLAVVFLLDPRLGMPRDWDLFAFSGVPLVLLVHHALLSRKAWTASALVSLLGFFLLAPRATALASEAKGIAVFDNYAELDQLKNTPGRYVLFAYLVEHGRGEEANRRRIGSDARFPARSLYMEGYGLREKGRFDEAAVLFRMALKHDPSYKAAWTALGDLYLANGLYDSAYACLAISDGLNPFNFATNYHLGKAALALRDFDEAQSRWLMAARLAPNKTDPLADLVRLYSITGEHAKYADCLIRFADRAHDPPLWLAMIADFHLLQGDPDTARRLYLGALERGLDPSRIEMIERNVPGFTLAN